MKGIVVPCALLISAVFCRGQATNASPPAGTPTSAKIRVATPSAAIQNALSLEQQAKYSEAEAAWKRVLKTQPRNAQAFAHIGLLEARQEHYPEAISAYRKAKAINPAIPQLNLNLGLALFKSGDFTAASPLFLSELKKQHLSGPEAQRLAILVAMSYYGAHDYKPAIPYLKTAAAADQRNLPLRLALAHCYLWTKQLDETMQVYQEILTIDPNSAEADMIAGEALDEKGDNAGAVQQFRDAAAANPKEPNVHFGLAYLYWTQKRYNEAIPEFQAELANDPGNNQAMIYLGDTYVQQNNFVLAKQLLEQAQKYETKDPLIHLDLGIVYMETDDKDSAIRELTRTVALEPDNVTAHFRLAKIYQAAGRRDDAKVEFAKASSLNVKHAEGLHERIAAANARPAPAKAPSTEEPAAPDQAAKPDRD